MACDPTQLLADAECLRQCIPGGAVPAVSLSLLCQLVSGTTLGPYVLKAGDTMTGPLVFTNVASNNVQVPFVWARFADANTTTTPSLEELYHEVSGSVGGAANGCGVSMDFRCDSDTADRQLQCRITSTWTTVANATRTADLRFLPVINAATTEALRVNNVLVDARNGTFFGVAGIQVVSARSTGWATFGAGVANKNAAALDTATVTTAQLAQIVKALMDALIAHGLIGA